MRIWKYASSYYYKTVLDYQLSVDVQSYVLLPRKSHLKEVQNQYEPFQTIEVTHPIYIVEMKSHQRSLSKT